MTRLVRELLKVLASRKLASVLMLAWAALLLVWVVPFILYGLPAPQVVAMVQGEIFFQSIYALIVLATLACIGSRMGLVLRRVRRIPDAASTPRMSHGASVIDVPYRESEARDALSASGFGLVVTGDGWAWGVARRFAPLGNLALHLAVVMLVIISALSQVWPAQFTGRVVVSEGETFDGSRESYIEVTDDDAPAPDVRFTLRSLDPQFYQDMLLFTRLEGTIADVQGDARRISLSSPWMVSPSTFVMIEDFGYSLQIRHYPEGSDAAAAEPQVYKLKAFPSGLEDSVDIDGAASDYRVNVSVYGDYVDRNGVPGTHSFNLEDPRIHVDVSKVLASGGLVPLVEDRLLVPGESLVVDGEVLHFEDVPYYAVFRIVRTPWAAPFLGALLLASVGSLVRLVFPRREALVVGEGATTRVSVRDEAYGSAPVLQEALRTRLEGRLR